MGRIEISLALVLLLVAGAVGAQEARWLPDGAWFPSPVADMTEPRLGTGLVFTNLFRDTSDPVERPPFFLLDAAEAREELHGTVSMGATVPVLELARWPDGGLSVSVQTAAFGRFRVEPPGKDLVASDWMVALPIAYRRGGVSGRFRVVHSSAHLGDELIQNARAVRSPFSFEALELLVGYRAWGPVRVYGGGWVVVHSDAERDPALQAIGFRDRLRVQAGADAVAYPWLGGLLGYQAGVDWQRAERADWQDQVSFVGGVALHTDRYEAALRLRFHTGPSPMGQFFHTSETFWGLDLVVAL